VIKAAKLNVHQRQVRAKHSEHRASCGVFRWFCCDAQNRCEPRITLAQACLDLV